MGYPPSFIKGRTKMKKIKTEEYSKWDKNLYKELTPLQALKEIKYMLDSPFTSSIIIQGLNTIENALVENEELKRKNKNLILENRLLNQIDKKRELKIKVLKIIKRCPTEICYLIDVYDSWEEYKGDYRKDERWIKNKEEFDLLKEVLINE